MVRTVHDGCRTVRRKPFRRTPFRRMPFRRTYSLPYVHFAVRTFCRTYILPYVHFAVRTFRRTDYSPYEHSLFRIIFPVFNFSKKFSASFSIIVHRNGLLILTWCMYKIT